MEANGDARVARKRETVDVMIHTIRLHHRIVEKRIDGLGVHHSQHRMLMRLSCMGAGTSQKEIAREMDVSPACVARTLKALAAGGLIDKREGEDGRCNAVSLLPAGERLVADSRAVFRQIDREMFEGFSEEELARLQALLSRVKDNLSAMERRDERNEGSV